MFAYISQRGEASWPGRGDKRPSFLAQASPPRPGRERCPTRSHVLPARRPRRHGRCRGARSSPHTHQPSGPQRVMCPRLQYWARGGGLRSRQRRCPRWRNSADLSDHLQPGSPARLLRLATRQHEPPGGRRWATLLCDQATWATRRFRRSRALLGRSVPTAGERAVGWCALVPKDLATRPRRRSAGPQKLGFSVSQLRPYRKG